MKSQKYLAAALLLTAALAPSLFADSRRPDATLTVYGDRSGGRRIAIEGRISSIDRDRNGFVIQLDRGRYTLFAPHNVDVDGSGRRTSVRNLDRGDYIRAVGRADSRGIVYVNDIDLLRDDDRGRNRDNRTLTGIVEGVDLRRSEFRLRDDRGRRITVELSRNGGRRNGLDDLRRGDRVTVTGEWQRDNEFAADRVIQDRGRW